ncbi:probable sphingolipid transporter spinster homolog 2 isoform X2 [Impatiens glandulifera]|uniref:probable sphingolipid transporter spinster homolog 2 isoform X2 n=1 Tax=Impatiens glandulifera TaxID=253017 RepID=UPI001FB08614|nr:probable sphingolipid transporter spinster homolog 2 isoform X2 [Impatiens glandulifera]
MTKAVMAKDSGDLSTSKSSKFTPQTLLVVFCVVNLLTYVDRGLIASKVVNQAIVDAFKLSNFQDGILSSAFSIGILLASPLFASLSKSVNSSRLIAIGLATWCFAVAGCGLSFSFLSLAFCRMLVGTGEASFMSLAAPFINENAPSAKRSMWLGTFYMCVPSGVALGYAYGGFVGNHFGWRSAFFGEAIIMLPFAIIGFLMKPTHLKDFTPISRKEITSEGTSTLEVKAINVSKVPKNENAVNRRFLQDVKALFRERVYVVNILGYIAYNFVIDAYLYWGPRAGYVYGINNAGVVFGGITVVGGVVGTVAGGYVLGRMSSTISNAFKLLSTATFLGAIFCFAAFCSKGVYTFVVLFSIGELFVFSVQGPVNYITLQCVKPSLRPMSMAISTIAINVFVPWSPLVGILQDHTNNWRITSLILTSVLFLAAITWFTGIYIHGKGRVIEDSEDPAVVTDESLKKPLIEEKKVKKDETSGEP